MVSPMNRNLLLKDRRKSLWNVLSLAITPDENNEESPIPTPMQNNLLLPFSNVKTPSKKRNSILLPMIMKNDIRSPMVSIK